MLERVIVTTGGTGGHIFPAIAVAEEIRRRNPKAMLLFVGGRYGQEADLAVNAGLDFVGLPVRGVMGRGLRGLLAALAMGCAVIRAMAVIKKTRPQVVVGFGGYAAFAGVLAARLCSVPTALHEQNARPGMSNRLLGRWVDRIFLSVPDTVGIFEAKKCRLTGNPVRAGISELYKSKVEEAKSPDNTRGYYGGVDAPSPFGEAERKQDARSAEDSAPAPAQAPVQARRAPRLLVTGGSQGARAMNEALLAAIGPLLELGVQVRHQTGQADYERVRAAYRQVRADTVRVEPFIMDMPKAYAWADLIFCRAGASTLAEITAAGLPALLTPFPKAAQDHQLHNARFMEERGAARLLEQKTFQDEPGALGVALLAMLRDGQLLQSMSAQSLALARPFAARDLVDELEEMIFGSKVAPDPAPGSTPGSGPGPTQDAPDADNPDKADGTDRSGRQDGADGYQKRGGQQREADHA